MAAAADLFLPGNAASEFMLAGSALSDDGSAPMAMLAALAAPMVSGNIAIPANGTYGIGQTLNFTVTFDQDVNVTGTGSTLALNIGGVPRSAVHLSKTTNSITYGYTVQPGDIDANGITVGAIDLNGSTVRNATGDDADLSLTGRVPPTTGLLVEAIAPSISGSIGVPPDGTYVAGQVLTFILTFDENVTVTGAGSTLSLTIGSAARSAMFSSSAGNSVSYVYTVQVGDRDADGIAITGLAMGGTTIRDAAGNNADISLAGHLPSTAGVLVDAAAPALAGNLAVPANGTYAIGQTLSFTVTFDENINVTGVGSTLALDIGGIARTAAYASKTANSVTYSYAVQAGDNDANGITIGGIALNGSTIRDAAGNNAALSLVGHLPSTAAVLVDGVAPVHGSATVNANRLVLTYAEASQLDELHAPAAGTFTVTVAGHAVAVDAVVVNGADKTVTLTLATAVANGQAVTIAYADPTVGNDVNAIQDIHGNDAASLAPAAVVNATPAPPAPPPVLPTTMIDGVAVTTGTVVRSNGTVATVLTIPVITASRIDQVGGNSVADIPLVKDADGNSLLTVQVPVGVGLEASGGAARPAGDALTDLVREIQARAASGSADRIQLTGGADGFVASLPGNSPLLVQTIVVGGAGTGAEGTPLGIIGHVPAANVPQTALVIDTRGQPNGMHIDLQNVDFAVVMGNATVSGGAGAQHVWGDSASQNIFLGPGDDVLHGGGGDDIVGSAGGNDRIYGDAGNDLIFGGEGNDLLDGGAGRDTARFVGNIDHYSLRVANGQLVITDRVGNDGTDTVVAVETLRFTGGQSSSPDAVLARLYEGLLHRTGSAAEVSWWMDVHANGTSMRDIAAAIIASPEASRLSGTASDSGFVASLYRHVLGRDVKAGEDAFWLTQLGKGADRASVALAFANSAEKLTSSLDVDVNHSDAAVLVRMYHTMFGRAPDESGLNFWLAAHEQGMSLGAIADAFAGAPEARGKLQDGSDAAFIDYVYRTGMAREPLATEKAALRVQLQHGDRGQLLLDVAESAETIAVVGSVNTSVGVV
jgi:uncharacterized repeat protein (TIGR02059 family)